MKVRAIKTRVFRENEDLLAFIQKHVPKLKDGAIVVVTSKIVALAEGRTADRTDLTTKEKLIRAESDFAVATKWVWLTLKDGLAVASAGIDESNADGKFILLPKDCYASARKLRRALMTAYKVKRLGVIIPDSRTLPLRAGAMGVALGYAGFKGIFDYRGTKDIFGRAFKFERANIADPLAAAAVLAMGEGAEMKPLAVIDDAPVTYTETVRRDELRIPIEDDIYLPFIGKLPFAKVLKKGRK